MKIEQRTASRDGLKWLIVLLLIAVGIIANQYFAAQILAIRLAAGIVLLGLAGYIAAKTEKGRQALTFLNEARIELRKVIWPTQQETIKTTITVVIMVIVVALFLWGIDSLLLWLIGLLTGQRG